MQDLDLKSLRLFVAACDHATIKLAAAHEHIEPSAISKRIAQLEAALGTPLLARGRRGVQPTPAGLALLERARAMLFTADRIRADVASFGRGIAAHVRIVASVSAIAEDLPDDLAVFLGDAANRAIHVDLEERLSTDVVRMVADGTASIGVCWDGVDTLGLDQRPYGEDALVVAVPEGHVLAARTDVAFAATLDFDHVGLPPTTAVHGMLRRAAARSGRTVAYRAIVSNFDAELRVVAAGLGISVIPRQIAQKSGRPAGVRLVPLTDPWARRAFVVLSRGGASAPPAVVRTVAFLEARAAARGGRSTAVVRSERPAPERGRRAAAARAARGARP